MVQKISLENTHQFSSFFLDYVSQNATLDLFYFAPPTIDGFRQKIGTSKYTAEQRQSLVKELMHQYENSKIGEAVKSNIHALEEENSYTVTTGHQLNIFTGPLYFIYKIATTINLAKKLSQEFPLQKFVPVYWMATEDHDFEEINNFILFGKTYTWTKIGRAHV